MHETLKLAGPLFYLLWALLYGTAFMSLFVAVDANRARRAWAFAARPLVRWVWVVPQALFFVLFVLAFMPGTVGTTDGPVLAISVVPAFVMQIAYLLRVVYPSPARRAAHEGAPLDGEDDHRSDDAG